MPDLVELRCKYCGAPLAREDVESDSPYVTCRSCGTTQQRVDAKKYMEQMMGQVQSWIARMVPGGFAVAQGDNVDPVARHSIFVNNVRPKLEVEVREYRLCLNAIISSPLIVLPFCKGEPVKAAKTSAEAFEFEAKMKSLEPMAVDDESMSLIRTGEKIANTYAMIVNNSKLLADTTPGRFAMMSNNFKESAASMKNCDGYEALASRLDALAEVCSASDMVLNGDALGCSVKAESGAGMLEAAKKELLANPKLAMTLRAVDLEIDQTRTLKNAADMSIGGQSSDPLHLLTVITDVTGVEYPRNPKWDPMLRRDERNTELTGYVEEAVAAKNGGTLPIATGGGDLLMPFWDVDLQYSFTTGTLMSKRTVVVDEDLMVPAVFTVFAKALSDPRSGLTDIFAAAPESSIMSRIKGTEDSISGGAGIGRLADSASPSQVGSRSVVLPLSTKREASRLVEMYLDQCSTTHSKLKLSRPTVKRLMYVPCTASGGGIKLPDAFKGLEPNVLKGADAGKLLKVRGRNGTCNEFQDVGRSGAGGLPHSRGPGPDPILGGRRHYRHLRGHPDRVRRLPGGEQLLEGREGGRLRPEGLRRGPGGRRGHRGGRSDLPGVDMVGGGADHRRGADNPRGGDRHSDGSEEQEDTMTIDETVDAKMKSDLTLTSRIALYIPIYRGYREKNLRREEDRAVRNEVAKALQGVKMDLATVERELVKDTGLMSEAERVRSKADTFDVKVKKAVNGYSGFHDAVKIDEADLKALVGWDAALVDGIAELREGTRALLDAADAGTATKADLRAVERIIDGMLEAYTKRDTVMRGFDTKE